MPATITAIMREKPFLVEDAVWNLVAPILAKRSPPRGRKRLRADRLVYEAIIFVLRAGLTWGMLPERFPPW